MRKVLIIIMLVSAALTASSQVMIESIYRSEISNGTVMHLGGPSYLDEARDWLILPLLSYPKTDPQDMSFGFLIDLHSKGENVDLILEGREGYNNYAKYIGQLGEDYYYFEIQSKEEIANLYENDIVDVVLYKSGSRFKFNMKNTFLTNLIRHILEAYLDNKLDYYDNRD